MRSASALWECSAWVMFDIKFKLPLNISAMPTPTLNCLFVKTGARVVFAFIPGSEVVLPNRPDRGRLLLLGFRSSENNSALFFLSPSNGLLGKVRRGSRPKNGWFKNSFQDNGFFIERGNTINGQKRQFNSISKKWMRIE